MADTRTQQGPSPEDLAQQSLVASHGVAQKAAAAHSAALDKLHQGIQSASAPSDREQHLLGLLASMPGAAGPDGPPGTGGADPGQAQQQAVWDTFPSTDPQQAQDMLGQADNPEHGLAALVQQAQADRQKFEGMQSDILQQIVSMLGSPGGRPAAPAGPPSPAMGGEGSVGYS